MLKQSLVRILATAASAALTFGGIVSLSVATAAPAAAADGSTVPPIIDTPSNAVTTDALPTAQINGIVWDQAIVGNTVYAGGQFTAARPAGVAAGGAGEVARYNLMSYNLSTGVMTNWAPNVNGRIRVVTASPDGSRLYIGGSFSQVNGVARNRIAAFNTSDGSLVTSFAPVVNSDVFGIAASNSVVYMGGWLTAVGSTPRTGHLAAVNASNGALTAWAPAADTTVYALALTPSADRVLVAGSFNTLNGEAATSLGSLSAVDGTSYPFAVNQVIHNTGNSAAMMSLKIVDGKAYSSAFWYGGTGNFEGAVIFDPYDGTILNLANCLGDTYDMAPMNGLLYMVSHHHNCSSVGGFPEQPTRIWQHNDAVTIEPTGLNQDTLPYSNHPGLPSGSFVRWFPTMTTGTASGAGQAGWTLESSGNYLVEGGEFQSVNGVGQQGLVRFTTRANGAPAAMGGYATKGSFAPVPVNLTTSSTRVRFQADYDREGQAMTYRLVRKVTNRTLETTLYNAAGNSTFWERPYFQYVDTSVVNGTSYQYKVYATDGDGNVHESNWSTPLVAGTNVPEATAYSNQVFADGASNYWRMDDASGSTTITDWAAAANNLTPTSTGVTLGAVGAIIGSSDTAATFSGADTVTAASSASLEGPNTFSEELWFNTTTTSGGKLLGFGNANSGTSGSYDRHIYMGNDGRLTFGVFNNGTYTIATPKSYNDGQWHHVVASLSPAGMAFYVDGLKIGANAGTTVGQPYTGYWRIGGDNQGGWENAGSSNYFNGTIDDVAIYPTALTRDQIRDHFTKSGRTVNVPTAPTDAYGQKVYNDSPILYWRLGESSGTTASDAAGNGQDGTYNNGPTLGVSSTVVSDNTAAGFNGSGQFVASNTAFSNPTVFSEEAWFNTTTSAGGKIIGFGSAATGNSGGYDRHVYMNTSGQLLFGTWTGQENNAVSTKAYNDGAWHHVVASMGADGMKLYVDGALVGTNSNTAAQEYTGYWRVGGDNGWAGTSYFAGTIDEAAVYDQVLSLDQVRAHYRASAASVNALPTGSIDGNCTAAGECALTANASDSDGSISGYSWSFGDGTATVTGPTASHTYAATGTYTVTLTITDDQDGTTSVTKSVTVKTIPPVPTDQYGSVVAADNPYLYWRLDDASGPVVTDYSRYGNDGTSYGNVSWGQSSPVAGTDTAASFDTDSWVGSDTKFASPSTFTAEAWFNTTYNGGRIIGFSGSKDGWSGNYDRHVYLNSSGQLVFGVWAPGAQTITTSASYNDGAWHQVVATMGSDGMKLYVDGSLAGTNANTSIEAFDGYWKVGSDHVWDGADGNVHGIVDEAAVYDHALTAAQVRTHYRASTSFVNKLPTASFTDSRNALTASFTSSASDSDGTVENYSWNFGDGHTSTDASPTHTYAASGTYVVSLRVTDDLGGHTDVQKSITVHPAAPAPSDAYGQSVRSDDPLLYWRLDETTGSTASDSTAHGLDGTYRDSVGLGAASTVAAGNKAADFTGAGGYVASNDAFDNPTTFSVEAWFKTTDHSTGKIIGFGNRNDANSNNYDRHVYLDNDGHLVFGVYDGTLNTISTSEAYNDDRWHQVVATFGPSGRVLYVDGVEKASGGAASAQGYTGYWRVGQDSGWAANSDLSGLIDEVAVYSSVLGSDRVAAHYAASTVNNAAPTADFTSTCTGGNCSFSATASDDGAIAGYAWQFGDGTTGTGATVSHTYASGTYHVTLTVTDNDNATTTVTHDVVVDTTNHAPVPVIGTPTLADATVSVDGSGSSDPDGNATIASFSWDFGDGTAVVTGTSATAQHTYAAGGAYTITLTVTDAEGASASTTALVTVANIAPTARFTTNVTNLSVAFDATTSTDPEGTPLSYAWDFGDGNSDTTSGAVVTHAYASAGTKTVKLTVTDGDGKTATVSHDVTVTAANQSPTASFTAHPSDLSVDFNGGGSSDPDGDSLTYLWDFGDGATATIVAPTHVFATPGTKTVSLTVNDGRGGSNTSTQTVTVTAPNHAPTAAFTATPTNLSVAFTSTSTDSDGDTLTYAWSFGDGATDTTSGSTVTHVYATAGTRTVSLTVSDGKGGTDTVSHDVTATAANQPPTAAFTATPTDLSVVFSGSGSSDPENKPLSYAWAFGDGATDTTSGVSVNHVYASAGTWTVTLTVTDEAGATNQVSHDVTVTAPVSNVIARDAFSRTVASGWGTADVGGAWTVNSSSTMSVDGSSALARITAAGSLRTALLNSVSARDVSVLTDVTLDKAPAGGNFYQRYRARVSGSTYYLLTVRFDTTGVLRVYLSRVISGTETVLKTTVLNGFNYTAGETLKVRFVVSGNGTTTLAGSVWRATGTEPGSPTVSTTDSTAALQASGGLGIEYYTGSGTTSLPLVAKVGDYSANAPGAVANQAPTAKFSASSKYLKASVDASDSSDPDGSISAYAWDFGDGATGTGKTASHTYAAAGTYTVKLTVTDDGTLTNSTTKDVTVAANRAPTAAFAATPTDLTAAVDASTSADPDGNSTIDSYAWDYGDGATGTGKTASHTYATAGTYPVKLTVTDDGGLSDSFTKSVTVTAPTVTTYAKDAFSRTASSGWGTADTGGVWTVNSAANFSVDGANGVVKDSAGGSRQATLNSVSAQDVSIVTDFTLDQAPVGGSYYHQVYARMVGSSTYYMLTARAETTGIMRVYLSKVVSGTETVLKSTALSGFNYTAGEKIKVRFDVSGSGTTALAGKVWRSTDAEPSSATASTTDTTPSLQAAGPVALRFYAGSSMTSVPLTIKVADFQAVAR